MLHTMLQVASLFDGYFFHPLHGLGYQFWSGIAGSFLTSLPGWFIAGLLFVRHTNCHAPWCLRVGKHSVDGTPYKLCKKHHPLVPNNLTLEDIQNAHKQVQNSKIDF